MISYPHSKSPLSSDILLNEFKIYYEVIIMSKAKKALKAVGVVLILVLLIVAGYLIFVFTSYERLEDNLELTPDLTGDLIEEVPVNKELSVITYNIGFGAYTSDYSFFMDGGESSWAKSKEGLISNIEGIGNDIKSVSPDFMILQEVDVDGTRTYHYDEAEALRKQLGFGNYIFSQNFDSPFLFWPITEPHGANKSGLLTGSDYKISSSLRRSLPVNSSLNRIVDLDRCYSITRFKTENGKELCIYDVHLSAYGSDAGVREGQLSMLTADLRKDADAGNYVICGGDFNHNLRGEGDTDVPDWAQPFPKEVLPSGTALGADRAEECDIEHNSCRNSDIAYIPGTTFTVLADGFIVSDNVKVNSYASLDWEFERSDHDPVLMRFELE